VLSVEENAAHLTPVRMFAAERAVAGAAPTPVEAGTLDITANVTLSVEVSPAAR